MVKDRCMKCGHPVFEIISGEERASFHFVEFSHMGVFTFMANLLFAEKEEAKKLVPRSKICPYSGCKCNTPIMGEVVEC